jgi:tight adherence protein B
VNPTLATVFGFTTCASLAAGLLIGLRRWRSGYSQQLNRRLETSQPAEISLRAAEEEIPPTTFYNRRRREFVLFVAQSGVTLAPTVIYRLQLLIGLAIGGSLLVYYDNLLAATIGFCFGWLAPLGALAIRRARRLTALQQQLPDALDLMARAVRAGASLEQALTLVGKQLPNPLGAEFNQCAQQLEMGLSVTSAVRALAERTRLMETRIFATAVSVHRQAGGNLSVTLERLSHVVRERLSYRRQFKAATAGGRFAAVLMASVAVLVLTYLFGWEPEYVQGFLEQPLGLAMLAAAAGLQILGLVWVAALLRSDY